MLFNSLEFAFFLPVVYALYWYVFNRNLRAQNLLIVIASYVFYGWWDWRFLSLLAFSSLIDFYVGVGLSRTEDPLGRRVLLVTSIVVQLGILGFFKYYNFFVESFSDAFTLFGHHVQVSTMKIILPVGISFYTFQTLSYSIDCYRKRLQPTTDLISFMAFVSFFPQLVAGPIERATHLLPQFYQKRHFDYDQSVNGMRQVLWGLFKKVVIADNCAEYANQVFNHYSEYSGSTLLFGAIMFAFQIYCDFSAYSDIASGCSRLLGFSLMRNFAYPYFSRDIAEFWRRWHISLSTWFRDYVYYPLGGSKVSVFNRVRNIFIVFLLSGFWHGANWTFIAWGFLNALYFIPLLLLGKNRDHLDLVAQGRLFPSIKELFQISLTFALVTFAWIFFRSQNISTAFDFIRLMGDNLLTGPEGLLPSQILFVILLVAIEWLTREKPHPLECLSFPRPARWSLYYVMILLIFHFSEKQQDFIYFQF